MPAHTGVSTLIERIARNIVIDPKTGCHIWQGAVDKDGYATIQRDFNGGKARAARELYEHENGKLPADIIVDHDCNVRRCLNLAHLKPITQLENVRRQVRVMSENCARGHSRANAYVFTQGKYSHRGCRKCREMARERYRQKKAAA